MGISSFYSYRGPKRALCIQKEYVENLQTKWDSAKVHDSRKAERNASAGGNEQRRKRESLLRRMEAAASHAEQSEYAMTKVVERKSKNKKEQ